MKDAAMAEVKLRPLELTDLESVHELLSDWSVVRHMLFPLCSRQDSEKFLLDAVVQPETTAWRSIVRGITDSSSVLIGLCGIAILRGSEEGEIWYLVRPDHWGRGLATRAAGQLIDFGFRELCLHRIWACCLPENPASAKVLEKVGMRREGLRRENLKIHGVWKDSVLYAVLADEWQTGAAAARRPVAAEGNKALVLGFVDRLINQKDPSAADDLLAADYVDHGAPRDQPRGPQGVIATYQKVSQALADMTVVTEDVIAEGDRVVTRERVEATHVKLLLGFPPSGKRVAWTAISIYRIAGGRIAERWGLIDIRSLIGQLRPQASLHE